MAKVTDPMDQYSIPTRIENSKLARVFFMKAREVPEKPGRTLNVSFDSRFPLIENFVPRYIYWVKIAKVGNFAGDHYHRKKSELFYPVSGDFSVCLENPNNQVKETIELREEDHKAAYIRPDIAHKVVSRTNNAILLVVANAPGTHQDEFYYKVEG